MYACMHVCCVLGMIPKPPTINAHNKLCDAVTTMREIMLKLCRSSYYFF